MTPIELQAIQNAGFRVLSAEPGQPVIVEEINAPPRRELPKIDLEAVLSEMLKCAPIPLNHRVRPQGKKVQPWREKQEAKRLSQIRRAE